MILTEFEGKQLLQQAGLQIPAGITVTSTATLSSVSLNFPVFVKAQVLHGNRELQNLVRKVEKAEDLESAVSELLNATDQSGQKIEQVLIEEGVEFSQMAYLALTYDTRTRGLVARCSQAGGTGMDDRGSEVETIELSVREQPREFSPNPNLLPVLQKLWQVMIDSDASLVEINPLVRSGESWYCIDAKIELEETAAFRHSEWKQYSERSAMGRPPTERELAAHEVSRTDKRGVAGESFFEFPEGNIGIMASGGGASQLVMDALLVKGIKPANYTEYSGNPTREKVAALADVVLSIPNLKGLFVVGSNATFTDIYDTLAGVVDGLEKSQYGEGFAVLIRRGGPRWEEAFQMVEERLKPRGYKLKLFGPDFPLVETAQEMEKLLEE